MCIDTHAELTTAWDELLKAKSRTGRFPPGALAAFRDVRAVDYATVSTRIRDAVGAGSSKITQVRLARELADSFRETYRRAADLARSDR